MTRLINNWVNNTTGAGIWALFVSFLYLRQFIEHLTSSNFPYVISTDLYLLEVTTLTLCSWHLNVRSDFYDTIDLSSFIAYHLQVLTRWTRWMSLVEHLSSAPVFSGVRVTRPLVLWVCFVDRRLTFSIFSFTHAFWLFIAVISNRQTSEKKPTYN